VAAAKIMCTGLSVGMTLANRGPEIPGGVGRMQ
jgi:hypothetical protein